MVAGILGEKRVYLFRLSGYIPGRKNKEKIFLDRTSPDIFAEAFTSCVAGKDIFLEGREQGKYLLDRSPDILAEAFTSCAQESFLSPIWSSPETLTDSVVSVETQTSHGGQNKTYCPKRKKHLTSVQIKLQSDFEAIPPVKGLFKSNAVTMHFPNDPHKRYIHPNKRNKNKKQKKKVLDYFSSFLSPSGVLPILCRFCRFCRDRKDPGWTKQTYSPKRKKRQCTSFLYFSSTFFYPFLYGVPFFFIPFWFAFFSFLTKGSLDILELTSVQIKLQSDFQPFHREGLFKSNSVTMHFPNDPHKRYIHPEQKK
ncbi:hypothetical protein CEXT_36731 [Caerostris extrusa]|uniref:Uncharacterized protein n=1 Tax=Caerostris extrusa TaxID=172846 RepID=A0AAV4UM46_CAEEX|nr:hypothetical protein CEXT_36731 [Caerostris extrusa]